MGIPTKDLSGNSAGVDPEYAVYRDGTPNYPYSITGNGNLIGKVSIDQTTPGTTNAVVAGGNVANGVADGGTFPVKVGGYAGGTIPTTVSTGQRVNLWLGLNGQTIIGGTAFTGADGSSNSLAQSTISSGNSGHLTIAPFLFNGTTWDRLRKPNVYSRLASSAASGSPTVAKASAGDVHQFSGLNTQAALRYLHIYNKASAPTLGTDTPIMSFAIPASAPFNFTIPNGGAYCSTGISYAFTTDIATIPTTGAAAADITAFAMLVS